MAIEMRCLEILRLHERLSISAETVGIRFQTDGLDLSCSGSWPRPLFPFGERLAHRIPTLIENGQAEVTLEGVSLSYEQIYTLSEEDAELFDSLCPWSPLSIELSAFSAIGNPDFRLRTRFLLGDLEVDLLRVGAFTRFRGAVYRLPQTTHLLLNLVEDLNRWPAERKSDRREVLLRWGEILALVGDAGTELDRYLSEERITVPDRVHLDLYTDDAGRVSVVPTFDDVPESSLHKEYLRFGTVQDIYDITDSGDARLRVVIRPEVQRALNHVKPLRRLSGRDKDRLLSNPIQLLGDDPEGSVADLLRFGPRVKGIGEYPAYVRAFIASGEKWTELGEEGEDPDRLVRGGLECIDQEGERKVLYFKSSEEAQQLLSDLQEAQQAQQPIVEFQGVLLPVRPDFISDLEQVAQQLSVGPEKLSRKEEKTRPPKTGVLIYENIEKEEYSEGTPDEGVSFQATFINPSSLLPDILKEHQIEGIGWLQHALQRPGTKGVLLADDMGLGKTLQVLAFLAWAIEHPFKDTLGRSCGPYNPILIVAPLILLDDAGWRAEMERFFKSSHFMPYQILHGKELSRLRCEQGTEASLNRPLLDVESIRQNLLIITNYETVANYSLTFATVPWSIVVADEAHIFKDPNTRIAYTMKALKADFRVAMTGTPVQNRLLDLWNLIDFLQPGPLLGSAREFETQYERRSAGENELKETSVKLRQRLRIGRRDAILLRRTKEGHLPGLPEKREHAIPCPLTNEQRKLHVGFIQQARASRGIGSAFSLLSSLNKLCQHPALLNDGSVSDSASALLAASSKLKAVINQLHEIRQRKEKALIFAWFRDAQEILKRVIESEFKLDVHILNGQTRGTGQRMLEARTRMIKEFEEKIGFNVLILSPEVAGVGLTIVQANHVLHYGRWWNPAIEDQATDRVYRIGQERDVQVYYFIATDPVERFKTFDEHLHSLISRKRRNAENFLAPQANAETLQGELFQKVQEDAETVGQTADAPSITTPQVVSSLSPTEFEALVSAMLEAEGFSAVLTPRSNDRGIDVVGVSVTEVIFVQCKHSQDGRSCDRAAIDEVTGGETYYMRHILPASLRGHRPRLVVVANGEADSQTRRDAEQRGVHLVSGKALSKRLASAKVTRPVLDRTEGLRACTIDEVKQRLQEVAVRIVT